MIVATFATWAGWPAVTALATAALVAGVFVAWFALKGASRAAQLEATVDLLREYRSVEMRAARSLVHRLPKCEPDAGLDQLDAAQREAVEMVAHYLDNVGTLVAHNLLKIRPAAAFFGGSAEGMWDRLEPYILAERGAKKRPTYQRHFEDLVARLRASDYEKRIERLRRVAPRS